MSGETDLVAKFSKGEQPVISPSSGTFSAARARLMLPKCRLFVGCKIDSVFFNASKQSVEKTFTQNALKEHSYVKVSAEVVVSAGTYVTAMDKIQARRKMVIWDGPAGLLAMQSFLRVCCALSVEPFQ